MRNQFNRKLKPLGVGLFGSGSPFSTQNLSALLTGSTYESEGVTYYVNSLGDDVPVAGALNGLDTILDFSGLNDVRLNKNAYVGNGFGLPEYYNSPWDAHFYYKSFLLDTQDPTPQGVFFSSDGTKMYEIGLSDDKIYQYTLTTAWDINTATYDTVSISTQDALPSGLFFKPDGTKMYEVGADGALIYQYTLSSAWDLSTATYDTVSIAAQDTSPQGIFFKSDGTKMYEIGRGSDAVYQYTLSSAWDLSTATYDTVSKATQDGFPSGIFFKSDGTKMYEIGGTNKKVYQYTLSSAWDLSTATYDSISVDMIDGTIRDIFFSPDGTKMYITDADTDKVYQYTLTTAWDLTTAVFGSFHWKQKDFHYFYLQQQTDITPQLLNNWAFLKATATSDTSNEIASVEALYIYSVEQTGSALTKLKTHIGIQDTFYGDELITNGGFDVDSNWNKGVGWSISGGMANYDGEGTTLFTKTSVVAGGVTYLMVYEIKNYISGIARIRLGVGTQYGTDRSGNGVYSEIIKVTLNGYFGIIPGLSELSVDNCSVKKAFINYYSS